MAAIVMLTPWLLMAAGLGLVRLGLFQLGYILVGAGITLLANVLVEHWKRKRATKDNAAALYHELASRVARCCYDFEEPWLDHYQWPQRMDLFTAGKFVPEQPLIYRSNADKIALLGKRVPSALMAFYFRLWVLERDIENSRADAKALSPYTLGEPSVRMIATRFWATLAPGLAALETFSQLVPDWKAIEVAAWESIASPARATGALREHLRAALKTAKDIGIQ
jgi:hypothetical protein